MMQRTANENAAYLRRICKRSGKQHFRLRFFASLCSTVQYFWGRRSFQIRYAAHFLHGLAMIFLRDSLCLSAVSLSRQRHDILDFSYCLLLRVLHVTMANWQSFGLEFHLWSSPSAFSGFVNISRPAEYFTACYTVLKRPNKVEPAVHGCNWLSVWTLSCRCPVKLSPQYQPCIIVY